MQMQKRAHLTRETLASRSQWREVLNAYPARALRVWRKQEGLTLTEGVELTGVSLRDWAWAELGKNPEMAWLLFGLLGDLTYAKGEEKSVRLRLGTKHANIEGDRIFFNRLWRGIFRALRGMLTWTAKDCEHALHLPAWGNIEARMPLNSDMLTWRICEAQQAFVEIGYRPQMLYLLEQAGIEHLKDNHPFMDLRLQYGGDIYKQAGTLGINPFQWWRWEQNLFYCEEERRLADSALAAIRDTSIWGQLNDQRERETPLLSRMKNIRIGQVDGTYSKAAAWLAQQEKLEGGDPAMTRRVKKRRNLRMASHHWGILENGCVGHVSSDEGLKAVAMGFMSGSSWAHYFNKHLRRN